MDRRAYPSDVSDEEWALVTSYLTLMTEDAPQRDFPLREVFNGLRWIARTGAQWRLMPHDLPSWQVVFTFVDQGYTGENAADAAEEHGIKLEVVPLPTAKRGFVLLPRRWVVELSFGWMARFRRLARGYERLLETLAGLHFPAFVILMLKNVAEVLA
jgi:transposase